MDPVRPRASSLPGKAACPVVRVRLPYEDLARTLRAQDQAGSGQCQGKEGRSWETARGCRLRSWGALWGAMIRPRPNLHGRLNRAMAQARRSPAICRCRGRGKGKVKARDRDKVKARCEMRGREGCLGSLAKDGSWTKMTLTRVSEQYSVLVSDQRSSWCSEMSGIRRFCRY
jgi:hypothetical protein